MRPDKPFAPLLRGLVSAVLACAIGLAAPGCGGDSGPNLTGTWRATGFGGTIQFNLNDYDGRLVGYGRLETNVVTDFFNINGNHDGGSVNFTITNQGYIPIRFVGSISSATRLVGTLHDSGFTGETIQLDKQ